MRYTDNLKELIRTAHCLNKPCQYIKIVSDNDLYVLRRKLIESIYGNVPNDDNSCLERIK